jgi:hypothetical protein
VISKGGASSQHSKRIMKGKISQQLKEILRDDLGRRQLRHSLATGKDVVISIGGINYRVSTKRPIKKLNSNGKRFSHR